jgi:hypothetical protein
MNPSNPLLIIIKALRIILVVLFALGFAEAALVIGAGFFCALTKTELWKVGRPTLPQRILLMSVKHVGTFFKLLGLAVAITAFSLSLANSFGR